MRIKQIQITNYKTYQSLDLDLSVLPGRPIILIGGGNGGGKTTLFEAICGTLYGLKMTTAEQYLKLQNQGTPEMRSQPIRLKLWFDGVLSGKTREYVLTRTYTQNGAHEPVEKVLLDLGGQTVSYESVKGMPPTTEQYENKRSIDHIIKANLPEALSTYFLFDAMTTNTKLADSLFEQTIEDNIDMVLGFNKFKSLASWSKLQLDEKMKERVKAEADRKHLESLTSRKKEINVQREQLGTLYENLAKQQQLLREAYERAKAGERSNERTEQDIGKVQEQLTSIDRHREQYNSRLNAAFEQQNFDESVTLPRLGHELCTLIQDVVRSHALTQASSLEGIPAERVRELAKRVLEYLQGNGVNLEGNTLEQVVAGLRSRPAAAEDNEYGYLSMQEVEDLKRLLSSRSSNPFASLAEAKSDVEREGRNYEALQSQLLELRKQLGTSDQTLIEAYEHREREIKENREQESVLKKELEGIEAQIENMNVQIQQEPDPQYDTLAKLPGFFERVSDVLLERKKAHIETEMRRLLNKLLMPYKDNIGRVEFAASATDVHIKLFHTNGNEIDLLELNTASQQIFIQVLLMVLRKLGDYDPPVMIDTVMGVLDSSSRDALLKYYFPDLADQTILLATDSELEPDRDLSRLREKIAKSYTLVRDAERQCSSAQPGFFGHTIN